MAKILILHGYGLSRSGSNLYVNNVAKHLAEAGHEVHVVCHERAAKLPEHFDCRISYDPEGKVIEEVRIKNTNKQGRVILHEPYLGEILPVYNWDEYPGFSKVKTFLDINPKELEDYLQCHVTAVASIVVNNNIQIIHSNHVLAMPEVARRVKSLTNCPFIITPHGSAIEYVVKKDTFYLDFVMPALMDCDSIVVGGLEMIERMDDLWGDKYSIKKKSIQIPVGTDLKLFSPRSTTTPQRPDVVKVGDDGACFEHFESLYQESVGTNSEDEILQLVDKYRKTYNHNHSDTDFYEKIENVDWRKSNIITFAGKMVVGKGIHCLLSACAMLPDSQLILAGEGSFRGPLELLVRAITRGNFDLFKKIVAIGWRFDKQVEKKLLHLEIFNSQEKFNSLHEKALDSDFEARTIFVGYATHRNLSQILANSNVTVLPSIISEAYPLSLVESLGVGIPPIATDIGGSKKFLDEIIPSLPVQFRQLRVSVEPQQMVWELKDAIAEGLMKNKMPLREAREIAESKFGWTSIAKSLENHYKIIINS